jgi:PadR family transcriptional regulator, regulatory protein PadR
VAAPRPIRISGPTLKVLKYLVVHARSLQSGADIRRATRLKSGTLYPLLARLNAAGWLVDEWETVAPSEVGRPKKHLYRLTGEAQLEARHVLNEFKLG